MRRLALYLAVYRGVARIVELYDPRIDRDISFIVDDQDRVLFSGWSVEDCQWEINKAQSDINGTLDDLETHKQAKERCGLESKVSS